MLLTRLQCKRFFNLFDALTVYANRRLDVVDESELIVDSDRGIDERAQAEVAQELWQNLNVIDDFVRDNPAGFSTGELTCVAAWREGLSDTFLVDVFPDGEVKFVTGGRAFEVTGLSKEIPTMLGELPASVHTTLLPFDGRIVYAEYLGIYQVQFGDNFMDLVNEEIERIFDEDLVVRTAEELLSTATLLREQQLARDTEEMFADLEHSHSDSCGCGHDHGDYNGDFDEDFDPADFEQHRGVLAGMSYDERDQAIRDHITNADHSISKHLIELLDGESEEIPLTTSLPELLSAENPHDVRRFAGYLGMGDTRTLSEAELLEGITARIAEVQPMQTILEDLMEHHITALQELAKRGGRWDVQEEEIVSLRDLPVHELGFSYVFHNGGVFSFVMPDEALAIADKLDWEGARLKARQYRELIELVDSIVELRGIAPMTDVVAEYQRCYPDGYQSMREIMLAILQAPQEGIANYELLEAPTREMYALHYELFWAYEKIMGLDEDRYVDGPVTRGELGDMLEDLLKQHEGKEPRPLTPDMLEAQNLADWKLRQTPAFAFTQYLDEHVPAAQNDYYFADKVMEELLNDAMWGLPDQGARRLFDILDNNGFMCEPNQIQEILDLWTNMNNGLPIWPNNGWSPRELAAMSPGPRVFFNEDGSIMNVGRNDPCPCGSGLKYKKCCGK